MLHFLDLSTEQLLKLHEVLQKKNEMPDVIEKLNNHIKCITNKL
mgnify:FL=1|jgi:hypothetical protein